MENQSLQKKQQNYWTQSEAAQIIKMLSVLINGQKAYGKDYSVKDTFAYYELKLQGKFSAEQILYALDKYTDTHNDIPAPSDIINMLKPQEPRVTEAQYVNACKEQERDGFPQFSVAYMTIADYKKQNYEEKETYEMITEWHSLSNGPQKEMWKADSIWLKKVLNGERVSAHIYFKTDGIPGVDQEALDRIEYDKYLWEK